MSGGGSRVVERQIPTAPMTTIPSQFAPFATQVGQRAEEFVQDPRVNLQQFLQPSPLTRSIPPLSPLQQFAIQQGGERAVTALPPSLGEAMSFQTVAGQPFQQFIQGDIGQTPAVQSAIAGLESTIVPRIQNERARQGLANYGGLPAEVGGAYARELVPLYSQGMQQQAAMSQAAANQFLSLEQSSARARAEADQFGGLEREAEAQRRGQEVQEFERVFNLIQGVVNPFWNFNVLSTPGPSEIIRRTSPSGMSLFK